MLVVISSSFAPIRTRSFQQCFLLMSFLFAERFDSGEDMEREFLGEQQGD